MKMELLGMFFLSLITSSVIVSQKIDPLNSRSSEVDSFYLEFATQTISKVVHEDIHLLHSFSNISLSPQGIIRGFYLFGNKGLSSQLAHLSEKPYIQQALNNYLYLMIFSCSAIFRFKKLAVNLAFSSMPAGVNK
jgi:DNA phosphorothioation-dependent restriction protein DptF